MFRPPKACNGAGAAEDEAVLTASMIGIDAPIVVFRQFKKFISVPAGRGVSAPLGSASTLLFAGALEGRLAELLYEVRASINEEAR